MADQDKYETLDIRVDDNLCWLTLNRPDSLNAMNRQLVTDLREFITQLPDRRDIRVVILKGAGRAFCAGLDIKESAAPSLTSDDGNRVTKGLRMQRRIADLVMMMRRAPQPFIACVQGAASGGGFALALASDVRIAGESARMNAAFTAPTSTLGRQDVLDELAQLAPSLFVLEWCPRRARVAERVAVVSKCDRIKFEEPHLVPAVQLAAGFPDLVLGPNSWISNHSHRERERGSLPRAVESGVHL